MVVCYTAKASWYTTLKPQLWRKSIFDKNGVFEFAIKYFAINGLGMLVNWWIQMPLASYSQTTLCAQMVKKSAYPACTLFWDLFSTPIKIYANADLPTQYHLLKSWLKNYLYQSPCFPVPVFNKTLPILINEMKCWHWYHGNDTILFLTMHW